MVNRYYIPPFQFHTVAESQMLFTPRGVFKIEDASPEILSLESHSGKVLTLEQLKSIIPLEKFNDSISSCIKLGIIKGISTSDEPPSTFCYAVDDPVIKKSIVGQLARYSCFSINEIRESEQIAPNSLVLIYQDIYSRDTIIDLQKRLPQSSACITAYRLDNHLIIDNPYIADISNPDHLDAVAALNNKLFLQRSGSGAFIALLDQFLIRKQSLEPLRAEISDAERGLIIFYILNLLKKCVGSHYETLRSIEINVSYSIDLRDGTCISSVSRPQRR